MEIKPTIPYFFFSIRCCMFDRYTNVYVPLCVPTSANWPFSPPVFMSGLHSLELQQCFLTQVLPCPHSYTAVIQACEWSWKTSTLRLAHTHAATHSRTHMHGCTYSFKYSWMPKLRNTCPGTETLFGIHLIWEFNVTTKHGELLIPACYNDLLHQAQGQGGCRNLILDPRC